jgi:hypothetical protein
LKNFMKKKWLGIPVVAIVAVLLVAAVSAAAIITLDHKTQTVTQPWVAPPITPAGTVVTSQTGIVLPSMYFNTEFSDIAEGTVTVTVNVPSTLGVVVTPGTFTEFGIVLTCTSGNAGNLEVSTYRDLTSSISFSTAGTYTFAETAKGYTGATGSGTASVDFNLTAP